jgi:hypothetical protein
MQIRNRKLRCPTPFSWVSVARPTLSLAQAGHTQKKVLSALSRTVTLSSCVILLIAPIQHNIALRKRYYFGAFSKGLCMIKTSLKV